MTNKQIETMVAAAVAQALSQVLGQVPAAKVPAAKVAPKRSKAGKVPAAKVAPAVRISELSDQPLDVLINRACAEAMSATSINVKRVSLCPNDLRVLISRPTNAAIKMHCRDKANGTSITDASAAIVARFDKVNGKGSAARLLAQFA